MIWSQNTTRFILLRRFVRPKKTLKFFCVFPYGGANQRKRNQEFIHFNQSKPFIIFLSLNMMEGRGGGGTMAYLRGW